MNTSRLLKQNIAISLVGALVGLLLSFVFSFSVGLVFHGDALAFRYTPSQGFRSIDTSKLEAFDRMQATALCFGAAAGLLAAQSVFIVRHLRYTNDNDRNA